MKIIWQFEESDKQKVKAFYDAHKNNYLVQRRLARNQEKNKQEITIHEFWKTMVSCQLTTQQRSGPKSPITHFMTTKPFPVGLDQCQNHPSVDMFVSNALTAFGGIRRAKTIGTEALVNYQLLTTGSWIKTQHFLNLVRINPTPQTEQCAANYIDETFKGFGPKQSRNLLQGLGLSMYEIPIDSRVIKWLSSIGFPIQVGATSLSDKHVYQLISDGFQEMASVCDIKPFALDAAIFSSTDNNGWNEDNFVW